MEKIIAIALSGGVDSLVAAFLLKQKARQVMGIHFTTGFEQHGAQKSSAAMISSLAEQLAIPVASIDIRRDFKRLVVEDFVTSYQEGRTPNPCMVCNAAIKFGILLEHAKKRGADMLATGHYSRIETDGEGNPHLYRGIDPVKDQSYFLARLTQDQLAAACFPLAHLKKTDVMRLAGENNLTPVSPEESQDICFIRHMSYADFLTRQPGFTFSPGPIVDINHQRIGTHNGLHLFTVGQRRGINIPAPEPYYVVRIIPEENTVMVGFKFHVFTSRCRVSAINWIAPPPLTTMRVDIQVRYRHGAVPGDLVPLGPDMASIIFESPQSAITPGQGAVFYRNDEVLGGGWIDRE